MASGAVLRRRLVEENGLARNRLCQLVALGAPYVLMSASQREYRFFVIKQRRFPLRTVVALSAPRHVALRELLPMYVLMAVLALCRRGPEVHIHQARLKVRRLMAVGTGRGPMGS
jgi:hypothetical protein